MKVLMCLRTTSLHCYKNKPLHQVQYDYRVATGQEMVKKKFLQGQGKAREFYFESGKNDVLKKIQGKWKKLNTADFVSLKTGINIIMGSLLSQQYFSFMKKENVLKSY